MKFFGKEKPHDMALESAHSNASAMSVYLKKYAARFVEYAILLVACPVVLLVVCPVLLLMEAFERFQKKRDEYYRESEDEFYWEREYRHRQKNDEWYFICPCCGDKCYDVDLMEQMREYLAVVIRDGLELEYCVHQLRDGLDYLEMPSPELRECLEDEIPEQKTILSVSATSPASDMPSKPAAKKKVTQKETKPELEFLSLDEIREKVSQHCPIDENDPCLFSAENDVAARKAGLSEHYLRNLRSNRETILVNGDLLSVDKQGRVFFKKGDNGRIFYYDQTIVKDSKSYIAFHQSVKNK